MVDSISFQFPIAQLPISGGGAEVEHAGDEALDEAVEVVGGEGGQRLVGAQAVVEGVREERGAGFVRAVGFVQRWLIM